MTRRALLTLLPGLLALLVVPFVQRARAGELPPATKVTAPTTTVDDRCAGDHWVGAWRAAPQGSSLGRPDDIPWGDADGTARTFTGQTLRMVVAPGAAGSALRVHLGNRFGPGPVVIDAVTVGVQASNAAAAPGSIRPLTFSGERTVVMPPGESDVVSDPLFIAVDPFEDLVVSFHVVGDAVLDHHQWAQTTSYASAAGAGDHADDEGGVAFTEELTGWFGVAGVDVLTSRSVGSVVTLGDSITDGIGSSPNLDRRWPDRLAQRFTDAGMPLSVVNLGIAGNHVTTSGLTSVTAIGPSAVDRLELDVLGVPASSDLIVFEGINDIYMSDPATTDIAAQVIAGYQTIIAEAGAAGLRVIGATITPASMTGAREDARLAINEWIRTSGAYDAVIDFDAVARDPGQPNRLRPEWDAGFAHLNDAGYDAMASAIDLTLFAGTGC